jgi:hypothetical protein
MEISGSGVNIKDAENKYRGLNFMWFRIKDTCKSASDWVKKQRKVTKHLIDNSDRRDVLIVRAPEKLATVSQPTDPGVFTSFDPKPFEHALAQLLGIQDEVSLAKTRRESMAAGLVAQARTNLTNIDLRIANAQKILQPRPTFPCSHYVNQAMIQQARPEADAADTIFSDIEHQLSDATILDANQGRYAEQIRREELPSRHASVEGIKNAKPYLSGPDPGCSLH